MVMFGNDGVSQSYLHTVTPQVSAMADPANSQIDGGCAAHAKAGSAETSTPPAHCETQQSERAEAGTRSAFAHPLSTEEELMALDVGLDGQSVPEGISDLSEPPKESETSVNVGTSLACSSGTEPLKSADRTPRSHQEALPDSAVDSEAEETQLSQSQGSSSLPEAVATHSTAGSDMDETLTKSAESASSLHSSSFEKYDFVMWYHPDDDLAAERIYKFLEGDLGLKGYRYCRDRSLGTYKLSEIAEAIRDCSKVLLFITPRSNGCGMFESQMHNSLTNSIESNRKNVIPIYWELNKHQGPNVVRGICSIYYQDCSETFKKQIARIFKLSYPESFTASMRSNSYSHQSVKSSVLPSLTQSLSAPCAPTQKSFWSRWFSSKK